MEHEIDKAVNIGLLFVKDKLVEYFFRPVQWPVDEQEAIRQFKAQQCAEYTEQLEARQYEEMQQSLEH